MKCKELFAKIDELNEKYLDMLEVVSNMESPTEDKASVDAVSAYFAAYAREMGWQVDVHPIEVSGDIVTVTMNKDAKGAPISLSGHLDTVHPHGLFGTPAVHRDEEYMYGPGVVDCKGGVVAGFLAMEALDAVGFRARPVRMLLQTDEEKGSTPSGKRTIRHICETALDSRAFLNLEGNSGGGAVIVTTKGIARYLLSIHGRAAHSSRRQLGASAILEAAHKIIALEGASDPLGKETTYNCGIIKGGTVPNSVAAECEVIVDIRYATAAAGLAADTFVREIAAHSTVEGCSCDVSLISDRPATELCEKNLSLLADANAIFAAEGLPVLGQRNGMGGTDMAYVTQYGIPCMDSIGVMGTQVHSVNERMVLASLAESAKKIAAITYCIEGDAP